jgi:hypothetical protein
MNEQGSLIIIGIHGEIQHGKSTFAGLLREAEPDSLYYESSSIISEVLEEANAALTEPLPDDKPLLANQLLSKLPPILKKLVHVDISAEELVFTQSDINENYPRFSKLLAYAGTLHKLPHLLNEPITAENKEYFRPGLQGLGGYLVSKVCKTIWYDEIVRRMHTDITDDTKLVIVGGLRFPTDEAVLRAEGANIVEIHRPSVKNKDQRDPTEAHRKLIRNDSKILNIGDIEDLRSTTKLFYEDVLAGSLQPCYITETSN